MTLESLRWNILGVLVGWLVAIGLNWWIVRQKRKVVSPVPAINPFTTMSEQQKKDFVAWLNSPDGQQKFCVHGRLLHIPADIAKALLDAGLHKQFLQEWGIRP